MAKQNSRVAYWRPTSNQQPGWRTAEGWLSHSAHTPPGEQERASFRQQGSLPFWEDMMRPHIPLATLPPKRWPPAPHLPRVEFLSQHSHVGYEWFHRWFLACTAPCEWLCRSVQGRAVGWHAGTLCGTASRRG